MTSGVIQLVSSLNQKSSDFLIGNPQITFFKSLYKQYSNFYITNVEQTINGDPNFNKTINCTIDKSGDLLKNIYLEITLPDINKPTNSSWYGYTNNIGCSIIKSVTLRINDQIIDKIYGESIDIYNNLNNIDVKDLTLEYNSDFSIRNIGDSIDYNKRHIYLKLPFWFSKSSGVALPIISLNNSDINLDIEFRSFYDVIKTDNYQGIESVSIKANSKFDCKILTEYIYLDKVEKNFFLNTPHSYLIEQLQFNGEDVITKSDTNKSIYINFKNPVKELFWVISVDNDNIDSNLENDYNNITKYTTYYSNYSDTFDTLTIKLNSMTLLEDEPAVYYRLIQSHLYHNNKRNKHIYSYSFSLNPSDFQPSGAMNFSDLNNALFLFKFKENTSLESGCSTNGIIKIYAYNYNILRIASGQASLMYIT
tara:strand:- start:524 stop:1789 length:1266 start_codon:yes stop_codon:yes gene_type:complete